mmetsp:Transcript_20134/g.58429  ORF Transcript_20134/g.58429 Transcript_20134/m.58429 type:complete len:262 (+) Transcript_20134:202-987(+)
MSSTLAAMNLGSSSRSAASSNASRSASRASCGGCRTAARSAWTVSSGRWRPRLPFSRRGRRAPTAGWRSWGATSGASAGPWRRTCGAPRPATRGFGGGAGRWRSSAPTSALGSARRPRAGSCWRLPTCSRRSCAGLCSRNSREWEAAWRRHARRLPTSRLRCGRNAPRAAACSGSCSAPASSTAGALPSSPRGPSAASARCVGPSASSRGSGRTLAGSGNEKPQATWRRAPRRRRPARGPCPWRRLALSCASWRTAPPPPP